MKLLAIGDAYLPAEFLWQGLQPLQDLGVELQVREWRHPSLAALQQDNLSLEQHGPQAVTLPDELLHDLQEIQILVVQFAPVGPQLLDRAPNLRVIGVLRSGTEGIDLPLAAQRKIAVLNTPGRNARAVAECTLGLILAELRNIARAHAGLQQGAWRRDFPNREQIPELCGKTVGLIGYGAVGRLVAHYLVAFGSQILVYDPYCPEIEPPARQADLTTLLSTSDVVSLHARLTPDNHHLLGRRELACMKPSAILVNTARSGLVDETALMEALTRQQIMGAALDVFDCEPLPLDSPWLTLDNVTLTPHLAGSTIDAFRNSPQRMAQHLARLLQGDTALPFVGRGAD